MSARLTHSSIAASGRTIRFWYDGQAIDGLEGETVAAALAASHIRQMRHTRDGGRRGLYCGMGACFDCLVTIDGVGNRQGCLVPLREGMRVETQAGRRQLDEVQG